MTHLLPCVSNHDTTARALTETPSLFRKDVEQILAELRDPLLPVRAQALVALRKLVLAKDEFARANRDKILDIFQTQLRDSDRFIPRAARRRHSCTDG